jgi:biotin operon repressor
MPLRGACLLLRDRDVCGRGNKGSISQETCNEDSCSQPTSAPAAVSEMKARQCAKIKELRKVLVATGFRSLDEQAKALGLSRSTTWTIIKAIHKNSGLSATVINRILAKPQLPPLVRATVVEYVEDKSAGLYGHNKIPLRRFNYAIDSSASSLRKAHESGDPYSKGGCERHNGSPVPVSRHERPRGRETNGSGHNP